MLGIKYIAKKLIIFNVRKRIIAFTIKLLLAYAILSEWLRSVTQDLMGVNPAWVQTPQMAFIIILNMVSLLCCHSISFSTYIINIKYLVININCIEMVQNINDILAQT